jgi:kynureninase
LIAQGAYKSSQIVSDQEEMSMTDFSKTRHMFDIPAGMIYLNGNSLGPMPKAAPKAINSFLMDEWRTELVRGWNTKNWFMQSNTLGDRLGRLMGAPAGSTVVGDTLSIRVFQAVAAALALAPDRRVILSDSGNFPTDLYMVEGLMGLRDVGLRAAHPRARGYFGSYHTRGGHRHGD